MVDPIRIERARSTDDAIDHIAFLQEELCEIAPILTGDAGDERRFKRIGHTAENRTPYKKVLLSIDEKSARRAARC
jgi:hypothetical protein